MKPNYIAPILDFIYELPDAYDDFPDRVLELIDQYFPFHKLTFIPLNSNFDTVRTAPAQKWMNSINTRGLSRKQLELYFTQGIESDPFRYSLLPRKYWNNPVITLEEALSESGHAAQPYRQFLRTSETPKQAVINLLQNDIRLGVISIYRTAEEKPFSRDELEVMRILSRFISQHYVIALSRTNLSNVENMFQPVYEYAYFGVMLLNTNYNIVQMNAKAREYISDLCLHLAPDSKNPPEIQAQNLIDSMMGRLQTEAEFHKVLVDTNDYEFTMNSFVSSDKTFHGIVLNHLLFIFRFPTTVERQHSVDEDLRLKLTNREWEIALLISQGLSNSMIAEKTFISLSTVKTHIQHIYEKLGVTNRVALIQLLFGNQSDT